MLNILSRYASYTIIDLSFTFMYIGTLDINLCEVDNVVV